MTTVTGITPTRVALTSVYCQNGLCPYLLHRKKPRLLGRLAGVIERDCPSCKQIQRLMA